VTLKIPVLPVAIGPS